MQYPPPVASGPGVAAAVIDGATVALAVGERRGGPGTFGPMIREARIQFAGVAHAQQTGPMEIYQAPEEDSAAADQVRQDSPAEPAPGVSAG